MESRAYSLSDMESEATPMTDADAARRALDDAGAIRGQIADKARCPPSWHAAFGVMMGAMVAGQALPSHLSIGVTVLCLGAAVFMMRAARRRMGFFVNGYRRGRTLWVAIGLLGIIEAMLFAGIGLKETWGLAWAPVVCGLIVAPIAVGGSYLWQAVYREEMLTLGAPAR
jgi:hypothetical protein